MKSNEKKFELNVNENLELESFANELEDMNFEY